MHLKNIWKTITISLLYFFSFASIAFGEDLTVTVLDVAQADAIIVQTAGKTVLIDAGEQKKDVSEQLQTKGYKDFDLVITTHPHSDHMGGMEEVVRNFNIKNYMDNGFPHTSAGYNHLMEAVYEKVNAGQMKYIVGRQGQKINLGQEAYFELLWPNDVGLSGTRSDLNANSIVMKLTHKDVCFLFMGDAEAETETIVADQIKEKCQVIKVSHHGSRYSSIPELINKVQPDIALISCGLANKHGHPGQSTLDTFQSMGTQVYRTDLMGEIVAVSDGKTVSVATEHPAYKITKININLAQVDALKQLPGIGEKTAEQIIEYRDANGPFQTVEDVLKVAKNSANKKRIEKILPFITTSGGSATSLIEEAGAAAANIFPSTKLTPSMMIRVEHLRNLPTMRVAIPAYHHHAKPVGSQQSLRLHQNRKLNPVNKPQLNTTNSNQPTNSTQPAPAPTPVAQPQSQGMVNINTADLDALAAMPGMNKKKAAAAIEHRQANGRFKSCASLSDVSGIGKKTVEKLLPVCTVE